MAYFPAFLKIEGCPFLIIGDGKIAVRKMEILREFGADVTIRKSFKPSDLEGKRVVIAAMEDKELNHRIAELCKEKGILVNAVDQIEDCTFIAPAYIKQGDVVAAFSSSGKSPVVAQYLKEKAKSFVTEEISELTEVLGSLRSIAKENIATEKERKAFFQEVLQLGIDKGEIPSKTEIEQIFLKFKKEKNYGMHN